VMTPALERLGDAIDRIAVHPLKDLPALLIASMITARPGVVSTMEAGARGRVGRARDGDAAVSLLQRRASFTPSPVMPRCVPASADIDDVELVFGEHLCKASAASMTWRRRCLLGA